MESKLRMELARDRFVAGIQEEYIQEALLRSPPDTLDQAREMAKCAEAAQAAQAARRRMRPKKTGVCVTSSENVDTVTVESKNPVQGEVAAVGNLGKSRRKQSATTQNCWNDFFPNCKWPAPVARTAEEL